MAPKKDSLTDPSKLLIHQFRNYVHLINMELDLAERGREKSKYARTRNRSGLHDLFARRFARSSC